MLVERARTVLDGDWAVVAFISTFDLRNGRRYRAAFAGAPADAAYADTGLTAIRHFSIPRLTDRNGAAAGAASAEIAALLAAASPTLTELLRNALSCHSPPSCWPTERIRMSSPGSGRSRG